MEHAHPDDSQPNMNSAVCTFGPVGSSWGYCPGSRSSEYCGLQSGPLIHLVELAASTQLHRPPFVIVVGGLISTFTQDSHIT